MMSTLSNTIVVQPLNAEIFKKYGDVIETEGATRFDINNGLCMRYHDLANVEISGPAARSMISILTGEPYTLPLYMPMVERHPMGSQAFVPLSDNPFLVVVCDDNNGVPETPKAFITSKRQGVNIGQNVWHGILTPLIGVSDFVVFDRGGEGNNLEEFFFAAPYNIVQD